MAGCVGDAALLPLHCGVQFSGSAGTRVTRQLNTATVSQAPRPLLKTAGHRHMCVADSPPAIHGLRPSAHPKTFGSVSFRSGLGGHLASSQSPFLSKLKANGSEFVSQKGGRRGLTVQATIARPRPAGTSSPARQQTSGGGGSNSQSNNNNARRSLPPVNRQQQQQPRPTDRGSRRGGEPRRANPPGPAGNVSSNSSGKSSSNSGLRRGRSRTVASRRTQPLVTRPKVIGEAGFLPNRLASDPFGGPGMQPMEQLELERGVCKPFKKYSPERVRARALSSPEEFVKVGLRGVEIVWSLSMYWLSLWADKVQGREDEMMPLRAAQLRNLLCDLGPSFIKAGQVLANRPDIIREDYMNELCILQDDVPAFPSKIAFEMMDEELGQPLEEVFSEISPEPVAAASLGQVYRARLRANGAEVAIKVQRPGVEPVIYRDLFLFRTLASFLNGISIQKLGCNAELIVDEFGEKLLDELDYQEEARNIQSFYENFSDDNTVKIPYCYRELCGTRVLVMEWIDGIRCTDPQAIRDAGIDIDLFITTGVSAALRQLLEFGLFHGDPHPGNIFAMRDGRIAYVDFGNVAELSQYNKEILIDAIVHAVNEDYVEMAGDFTRLGFLAPGTDVTPIVPALEAIWQNSTGQSLADFNFRTVTTKFNELVYNYPIRIPERFSLVIRSLLTQEGICLTLEPNFKFLEVAYPYVAKRLLTDPDPALRSRLIQVLFKDGVFQWKRLENLIVLAREQVAMANRARVNTSAIGNGAASGSARIGATGRQLQRTIAVTTGSSSSSTSSSSAGGLDLRDTLQDGARLLVLDEALRRQLLMAFTQDSRLHVQEVMDIYRLLSDDIPPESLVVDFIGGIPRLGRDILLSWSDAVLAKR